MARETRSMSISPGLAMKLRAKYSVKAFGEEARNYDFNTARQPHKTTNNIESTALFVKTCLGGGAVAMHVAYIACGVWTALCLTVAMGLLVGYCMYIMTRAAQKLYGRLQTPQLSYSELAEASMETCPWFSIRKHRKRFRCFIIVMCNTNMLVSCCIYHVIIARALKQLMERTNVVVDNDYMNIRFYILILMVPSMLLCMSTSLKYLAPFSLVADAFMITVAIATIYYGSNRAKGAPGDMQAFNSIPGLFEFIGVCVFSLEGAGTSLAIENHMENPHDFVYVLIASMVVIIAVMMIIGFFGSWGFGKDANSPVTINFSWTSFPIMLKIFMMITLYVNVALSLWLTFDVFWRSLKNYHEPEKYWIWERVYRCLLVALIILVAFILPNVTKFMALIGSFCLPSIAFIYPACISLMVEWEESKFGFLLWRLWQFLIITIFGLTLFFAGTYINGRELITELFLK